MNTRLETLPQSIGQLAKLTVLNLNDNTHLQTLPPSIGQLKKLQNLEFS